MKCIDELIRSLDGVLVREEDEIIKANLTLIKSLIPKIQNSQKRIYIEKIIDTFCEVVEMQRDLINESDYADAIAAGFGPVDTTAYIPVAQDSIDRLGEFEQEKAMHPFLPPMGEFQSDEQVRKGFYNYLKYHTIKETKSGKQKPLSKYTIYDYCSRIRVLYEMFYKEWQEGKLEGNVSLCEEIILPGKTFLNAYNIIETLRMYVEFKSVEIRENVYLGNQTADTDSKNPLNNPKNLGNTIAALTKFEDFKKSVLWYLQFHFECDKLFVSVMTSSYDF